MSQNNPSTLTVQDFFKSQRDQFDIHIHSQEHHGHPHNHEFVELLFVSRGFLSQTVNGNEITLHQGECCLLDLHSVHQINTISPDAVILQLGMQKSFFQNYHFIEMISFTPQNSFLNDFLDVLVNENFTKEFLVFHTSDNRVLMEIIDHILLEYTNPDFCAVPVLINNLFLMFFELIRAEKKGLMVHFQDGGSSKGLSLIMNYISKHCSVCTLSDTAQHFGYSSGYLGRLLKENYQKSFQDIRMEFRLLKSARLLAYSFIPVSEIAKEVGYQNLSYYYRIFQNQFGMTPQEYRELSPEKRTSQGHKLLSLVMDETY